MANPFSAFVTESGGGCVSLVVDRNTEEYPSVGDMVMVYSDLTVAELKSELAGLKLEREELIDDLVKLQDFVVLKREEIPDSERHDVCFDASIEITEAMNALFGNPEYEYNLHNIARLLRERRDRAQDG